MKMSNTNFVKSGVKESRMNDEAVLSSRCSLYQQHGLDHHPVTTTTKWSKQVIDLVMECYYRGVPVRGYRKKLHQEWRKRGLFECIEQKIYDQAKAIVKNGWFLDVKLEVIKRRVFEENSEAVIKEDNAKDKSEKKSEK